MSGKDVLKKSESILLAKKIFIESMHFQRDGLADGIIHFSKSSIGKNIEKIGEDAYKSSLLLKMTDEQETATLEIVVSGIFEFRTKLEQEKMDIIITKNTVAILFPYLRSQVTLMTAQPDIEPVVIPAININALLKNMEP